MIRMSIQLPEEQVEVLRTMAKTRKASLSQLIRESVTQFLAANLSETTRDEKRQRALAAIRKIELEKFRDIDGKTDLSINHDKYLDEIYAS